MRTSKLQRGASLLEAVFAMGILLVGATGLAGLQRQSSFFMGDARRAARAAAFGQDLVNQIELWDYTDARLDNSGNTGNDGDVGDAAGAFENTADPIAAGIADYGEGSLGANFTGLPGELLRANDMERYWNVAELDADDANANGTKDAKRVAVIVRWRAGSGWRKVVFMTTKINTADVR